MQVGPLSLLIERKSMNCIQVYCCECRRLASLQSANILPTPPPFIVVVIYKCLYCKNRNEVRYRQTKVDNMTPRDLIREVNSIVDENHPQGIIPYSN